MFRIQPKYRRQCLCTWELHRCSQSPVLCQYPGNCTDAPNPRFYVSTLGTAQMPPIPSSIFPSDVWGVDMAFTVTPTAVYNLRSPCLEMLECLGIPWVQAAGEAEAMCAYLNASGHVDGCLTNDGDAFLYGAQTVYRNFTMNTKDPHVDCYTISSIKSKLGLDRDALVGLAVLLGLPGVGKEQALKLLRILKGQSLLQRFNQWIEEPCSSAPQPVAKSMAHCSVCSHPGSPKDHERNGCALCNSDRYCEPHDYEYRCPCEWHQTDHSRQLNEIENNIKKVVKPRIRNGVRCLEIEWEKPEHYAVEDTEAGELDPLTIEDASLFEAAYPEVVAVYQKQQSETQRKKQKSMKVKPKGNCLPEPNSIVSSQSLMTLKPTCGVFPKHHPKINLEISPDPISPQESTSPSLPSFVFPESAPCLNLQEHSMPSPRPSSGKQTKDVSDFLVSEWSQPSSSSHNISAIADLQLSAIDWDGTSFSNSPAVQRNTLSQDLQSELQSSAILPGSENHPEQLSQKPEQCTTNNDVLGRDLQKTSPAEHLLPAIAGLHLHDLPLKERIHMKSSCPQYSVQAEANLESLHLKVKGSCVTDSSSVYLSNFSKEFPGILQKESKNLKGLDNELLQGKTTVNASIPDSENRTVETSSLQAGLSNSALPHNPKIVGKTAKNLVKNSVCLKRDSSDDESAPVSWKTKRTAPKLKPSSQKLSLAQVRDTLRNPQVDAEETKLHTKTYSTAEGGENWSSDPAKRTQSFLHCHEKDEGSAACSESPLPLCQRLKLRLQSTSSGFYHT
ncbi:Flap endonuclease GEN-like protein 1 [Microtus ochrogaster]|uniref:Flap endonuclease GEN-like protein 1 n=1 Tax=Microtus ochrogaster TaxID=79684 RepID=A0A8J6GS62_MICOH|nr:Flap endonuclease GEN-like protein 1 [Microtus ochrogaster]